MTLTLSPYGEPIGELRLTGDRLEAVAAEPSAAELLRLTFAFYADQFARLVGCEASAVAAEDVLRHIAARRPTSTLRDD